MADYSKARTRILRKKLTQAYLWSILNYNPLTGSFVWKSRSDISANVNARFIGKPAGWQRKDSYLFIGIQGTVFLASHLAYRMMTGKFPKNEIDHEDTDPSNNRWKNFRPATRSQNMSNTRARNGFKGVSLTTNKQRWRARIGYQKKHFYIGTYDTEQAAHAAYCEVATRLHKKFARF